jgi:hypothetical protein
MTTFSLDAHCDSYDYKTCNLMQNIRVIHVPCSIENLM